MLIFDNEKKFNYIFKNNIWGSVESISGPGSELKNTIDIRNEIPLIISSYSIKSILDIPCGDFNWFKEMKIPIKYLGGDIVCEIIDNNNNNYRNENINFQKIDITKDLIPNNFDLIIIRDLFIHFSDHDIFMTLKNIKKTNSRYILTTNYDDTKINKNIVSGSFREVNLMLEPFLFPKPICKISDSGFIKRPNSNDLYRNKYLSLWDLNEIQL